MRKILTKTLTFILCLSMAITVTTPSCLKDEEISPLDLIVEDNLN